MPQPIYLFKKIATYEIDGNKIKIKNIRNHSHNGKSIKEKYIDKEYDLRQLKSTWMGLDALKVQAFSHIYFIFQFKENYLAISVEARRWTMQARPVLWGWLPLFPIHYNVVTEDDIFNYRTITIKRKQHLYKMKLTHGESVLFIKELLTKMEIAEKNKTKFNAIFRNCNTEVLNALRKAAPEKFNSTMKTYYVSWIDHYFYQNGLIHSKAKNKNELRKLHDVSSRIKSYKKKYGNFSKWIRKDL